MQNMLPREKIPLIVPKQIPVVVLLEEGLQLRMLHLCALFLNRVFTCFLDLVLLTLLPLLPLLLYLLVLSTFLSIFFRWGLLCIRIITGVGVV